jgi:hypothetical protein
MAEDAADQLLAVYTVALRADATIDAFCGDRIYNFVPRKTREPYIVIHITDSDEWDTSTEDGEEHSVYIHVWDDKEGSKRVNQIMRRVKELLHDVTTFVLTDHNLVNCRRVSKQVIRDGQLYHGIGLFRAITEET